MPNLNEIAARLDEAARGARAVPQLPEALSLSDAYDVQSKSMERRYDRGERRIGVKLGFTSRAKMIQMGVSDLIWGRLTDQMLAEAGSTLSRARFVHPRVEPEIAFLIKDPLEGRVDPMTAMAAVAGVAPALEVIDSRYENFRFSVTDVVADNTSAAAIVIGPWSSPSTDVANLWHAAGNRRGTSPDWINRRHSGSSDLCVGRRSAAGAHAGGAAFAW